MPNRQETGHKRGRATGEVLVKERSRGPKAARDKASARKVDNLLQRILSADELEVFLTAREWTQADVVGLQAMMLLRPPTRIDPETGEKVIDGRAAAVATKQLRSLSAAIESMRADGADLPDSVIFTFGPPPGSGAPDAPRYYDDHVAALARARELDHG